MSDKGEPFEVHFLRGKDSKTVVVFAIIESQTMLDMVVEALNINRQFLPEVAPSKAEANKAAESPAPLAFVP